MKTLGNLVWLVFGGFFVAFEYLVASCVLFISIIGIPFGVQTMKLAGVALWPFGKEVIINTRSNSAFSLIFNIIWLFIGGFWIALTHLFLGALFCLTILGIPFGKQHFKLAVLALSPFGRSIVKKN